MNKHTATLMMTMARAIAQAFADEPALERPKATDYVPSGSRAAAEDKELLKRRKMAATCR